MSTRGTYEFQHQDGSSKFFYVHHDNYPEGAAEKIWKMFENMYRTELFPEPAFLLMNDRAGLTESHDSHSDTDYRYTFKPDMTLIAESCSYRGDEGAKQWKTFYEGAPKGFMDAYLNPLVKTFPLHVDPFCIEYNKMMIKSGADINLQDADGDTPLHNAASCRNLELVKILYQAGADPSITNNKGELAADVARGDELIDYLEAHPERVVQPEEKAIRAVNDNNIEALRTFLNEGGNPNTINHHAGNGESLLSLVGEWSKDIEIAKLLIEAGADVNHQDYRGWTPLHWGNQNEPFCRLLIENGADIFIENEMGRTPQDDNLYTPEDKRVNLGELQSDIETQKILKVLEDAPEPEKSAVRVRL